MAMLAEPRRKQKVINLRAKNNAWSNDSSKFGQRMLEKMGWSSGKGLGANENGITEHVIAKYKNDEKGLGFEDKNDQWVKHEDDFNALLANLSNANDNTENLHSGISLEDKSKKSKARIHYHKFTRGKDISRYSEKDLANIFGKKSLKNTEEAQVSIKEDIKTTEQIFTEKGSMEDYFKNKLAEFKSKSKFKAPMVNEKDLEYDEPGYGFQGFSQENDGVEFSTGTNYQENKSTKLSGEDVVCNLENFKNKKKKSKTHENYKIGVDDSENSSNTQDQQTQKEINGKIKEKKVKNKIKVIGNNSEDQEYNEGIIKKKKSKSKQKHIENNSEESMPAENADANEFVVESTNDSEQIYKSKKKSKKKVSKDISPNREINNVSVKHTKKSSKPEDHREENLISHDTLKKEKSKRKNEENVTDMLQHDTNLETISKKKKKKKSKNDE